MPSWKDGETSSNSDSLISEFVRPFPDVTFDPSWDGLEDAEFRGKGTCEHGEKLRKYVSFEGTNVGRRFLGCQYMEGAYCLTVDWVDKEWTPQLQNSLLKLWELYDVEKTEKLRNNCETADKYYNLVQEKQEVEELNKKLQAELSESIKENHTELVGQLLIDGHKLLKEKACKERDALKKEKMKLGSCIAELMKDIEDSKEKASKERDVHKQEKRKLEFYIAELLKDAEVKKEKAAKEMGVLKEEIADLLKDAEQNKDKLQKIKELVN